MCRAISLRTLNIRFSKMEAPPEEPVSPWEKKRPGGQKVGGKRRTLSRQGTGSAAIPIKSRTAGDFVAVSNHGYSPVSWFP